MVTAGINIGSRFIKFVVLKDNELVCQKRLDTGFAPQQTCHELIAEIKPTNIVVTGYGRQLLADFVSVEIITEIKAVALGAYHVIPACRTIIDIGGQDTKVISLNSKGGVGAFEMNDRCAAGTGRFLEVMAGILKFSMEELGSLTTQSDIVINSLCTVFAESEVIGLIARNTPREEIGYAVQKLIAGKVVSMAKRQKLEDVIVFTGGCAPNQCLRQLIEKELGHPLVVNEQSPLLAAYGAALYGQTIIKSAK